MTDAPPDDAAHKAFLAKMSHDIRTPMNAILGLTSLLGRSEPLTPRQREFITTLNGSAGDLAALLDQLFAATLPAGATAPAPADTGLILLVEDYEPNIIVASELIGELGYRLDVARNGAEAVQKTADRRYAVVLMDIQMPGMDGLQATRKIRLTEKEKGGRRLPIVAMTAHATADDRDLCLRAGMDDYLSKPFRPQELEQKLKRYCGPAAK